MVTRSEIRHKNTKYRQLVKNKNKKTTSCPCTSYEVIQAREGTVQLILNLSLRWKGERIPSPYWIGCWVDPKPSLNILEQGKLEPWIIHPIA